MRPAQDQQMLHRNCAGGWSRCLLGQLPDFKLQQSVKHAGIGAGLISAAGLLAVIGLMTLVAAAVAALALVLPVWAAAVIVAVVLFIAAGIAALFSRKQAEEITPPVTESAESVKADIKEVKDARQ